jgi:hypothetical protein
MTYYYIYQITNLLNAKIYVGVHKTTNLNDGYMGSGKIIRSAIKKYGLDNFRKDILEFLDTSEAMYAREKEIVNENFLSRKDIYNIMRGGFGGFEYINANGYNKFKTDSTVQQLGNSKANREKASITSKKTFKIIKHQQGSKNSQYGRMWISNVETKEVKRILNSDPIPQGWVRGKKGKEKTTCWVNNTVSEYLIKIEEKQEYFSKGFDSGRLTLSMPQSRTVV